MHLQDGPNDATPVTAIGNALSDGPGISTPRRLRVLIEAACSMYIVAMLSGYAIIKLFQAQFANRTDPYKAELRVSELSSSALLWATYARAPVYEVLLGLVEAMCVVLVFVRRTRPIGALLTLAVMANVTAMNVLFEIPALSNAGTLAIAALILVVLFLPTYRRWLGGSDHPANFPFGASVRRVGLVLKTLALVVPCAAAVTMWATLLRPLDAMRGDLYGRWRVESVEGSIPTANGVAPLAPGSIVMFNKMNVLAVRSGDLFHFGRYVEDDSASTIDFSLYEVTLADLANLPPPVRLEERASALTAYPLGYSFRGTFDRTSNDGTTVRISSSADQPKRVLVLARQ